MISVRNSYRSSVRQSLIHDAAIWDNRSVFHTATGDHEGFGPRTGNRAVGVGEVPYFDPQSKSRRESLGILGNLSAAHL